MKLVENWNENIMEKVLFINKPSGITSYDVLRVIKRKFNPKKIGHAGTLDPLASGLLIVLIDDATKRSEEFMSLKKRYFVRMQLGIKTDTGDLDGKIIENKEIPALNKEKIQKVLLKFTGKIKQVPHIYSAIKYKGKKLYEYARAGIEVKIKPRIIEIYKIKLLKYEKNEIELKVDCSKGTYIRKLVEDIAEKLKTCGVVSNLVREKIGKYSVDKAIDLNNM
ncbi:MAG: tRNA pseudouridine(55) synthase TruB [Elusimicrobia bacterium RIFOXYD2_FULL_34_15]|nr:MAG: tRNA pseudouridine(55) synthase TruB [Elusimicrobia bacterium RIFOXYD2_FULL_34_15]